MVSFTNTIIDEIALEGLDGVTLSGLWKILSNIYKLSDPFEDSFKKFVWSIIIQKARKKLLLFYEIPGPIKTLSHYDRHQFIHEEQGVYKMPDNKYFNRNPFHVIEFTPGSNLPQGSCLMFKERKRIPFLLVSKFSIDDVERMWGTRIVIVASQEIRERAIICENSPQNLEINACQYAILEMIGKTRYNGETFAGPNSMSTMMKDPKPLNYLCDLLHSCGLVTKQTYNCKVGVGMDNKIIANKLLLLTRFHSDFKTEFYLLMEKMYNGINLSKTKELDLSLINFHLDRKKMFKITQFKRLFKVNRMPTDEKDKKILISLQSDDIEEEFIYADNEYRNKEFIIENLEEDQYRVDMSFVDQFYEICHSYGSVGISQSDMTRAMSISKLNMKLLIRQLEKLGLITSYKRDSGRQSLNMFVTIENRKNSHVLQAVAENVNNLANLKCADAIEPDTPNVGMVKQIYDSAPDIACYIMEIQPTEQVDSSRSNFSLRQSRRKTKIVEIIDKNLVVELISLKNMLLTWEKDQELSGSICTKSVIRSVNWLAQKKIVNFFQLNVAKDNVHKTYKYVTHPSINHDHRLVISEKNRRRQELFLSLVSHKNREISQEVRRDSELISLIKRDLKAPKFLAAKYFHNLLFYLAFELDRDTLPVVPQIAKINFEELYQDCRLSDMLLYRRTIDWKMFIPPLPKYERSTGWIYLPDVIERIPLSIFSKLFPLDLDISDDLRSIITHPVKQNVLMKSLPLDIWALMNRTRLQRTYAHIVKLIGCCGLIQLSERIYKDPNSIWVYLNRNATILDTTKSESGYNVISLKYYRTLYFRFTCTHDVMGYWDRLQNVCLSTSLGILHKRNKMKKLIRKKPIPEVKGVKYEEAPLLDNGTMLGDRRGAGGIDSNHYSYLINNWNWSTSKKSSTKHIPEPGRSRRTKFIRRPKAVLHKKPTKMIHKVKRKIVSIKLKEVDCAKKKIKKIKYQPDNIDREAIKSMRSLRVKWTTEEDNVLKVVKAAHVMLNISPIDFILLQVAKIMRDIIRCTLGHQKTAMACLRRIQYIIKERKTSHSEIQSIICEFQKYPHVLRIYNADFINNMKVLCKNKEQLSSRLSVHFVLLCGYYYHMKGSEEGNSMFGNQTAVPRSIEDFFSQYSEYIVMTEKHYILHTNPLSVEDVQIYALNNLIHSVLCSSKDKRNYSAQLLDVYKEYPEATLQKTLTKIKDDQLAVRLKRRLHHRSKIAELSSSGLTYIFSSKYKQMMQFTKIPYEIFNKEYTFLKVMEILDSFVIKSTDMGEIFFLAEKNYDKGLKITSLKLPKKILTVDNTVQQNLVSEPERILEHFRQIFVNSPKTLYLKQFENEHQQNPTISQKVKFTVSNEKYTVKQDPFEIVLKTSNNIHFFCILSNMNKNCHLDFTKISKDVVDFYCPFGNCVLKSNDICSTVESIVNEQKQYILEDSISSGNENENYTHCDNFVNIMILPGNFWKIFHYIKRYIIEHNSKYEKKDIGKVQISVVSLDMVFLAKSILNYQSYNFNDDEFNDGNEYEASFNKEQKLLKAQDIFVINLPEIILKKADNFIFQNVPNSSTIMNNLVRSCIYTPNHIEFTSKHPCLLKFQPADRELCYEFSMIMSNFELGMDIPTIRSHYHDHIKILDFLNVLCENNYAMRLGVSDYTYVHHTRIGPWLISSSSITRFGEGPLLGKRVHDDEEDDDNYGKKKKVSSEFQTYSQTETIRSSTDLEFFYPQPWLRVNTVLNNRVLHKWMGSILTECITRCGCYISHICIRFNQMHPTSVRRILETLEVIGSVELKVLKNKIPTKSLFSNYDHTVIEEKADGLCTKEEVFILPTVDAVSKLNLFIGDKKYEHDFI
ncbi:GTF3C1 family protein [Megaselia abdita]